MFGIVRAPCHPADLFAEGFQGVHLWKNMRMTYQARPRPRTSPAPITNAQSHWICFLCPPPPHCLTDEMPRDTQANPGPGLPDFPVLLTKTILCQKDPVLTLALFRLQTGHFAGYFCLGGYSYHPASQKRSHTEAPCTQLPADAPPSKALFQRRRNSPAASNYGGCRWPLWTGAGRRLRRRQGKLPCAVLGPC